nr:xylulose kinase-1 [Tanacetum cinerariifolium]
MAALIYKDDHNKVAYLEKGKGWEAYVQVLDFLNRSHIRYALTHRPPMVFDSLVKQFWATATVRTLEVGHSDIIATIDGNEVMVNESLIRTQLHLDDVHGLYDFTLNDVLDGMWAIGYPTDGSLTFYKARMSPQWRFLIHTLIHFPAGRDVVGAAANVAAGPGPSSTPQEPIPNSPSPPYPPPSSAKVGPTTSSRPPSPSRPPSGPTDIREGGGDFASSLPSNEAPQTPAATAAGGAEESTALTVLTLKHDECLHRVSTLETELGVTKKVLGGAVLKLVTRVKRLEGLLQQRKRQLVFLDSEGEDATKEQEFDLAALYTLASVTLGDNPSATVDGLDVDSTMPVERTSTIRRRLRKSSPVDVAVPAAVASSSSIPTDKGKALMVDDSSSAALLSEQECVLKNLHDSQLGEELAKKIQAEQEAEFYRQQEEELDAAQLIYTKADWLDMLVKIATNSALSKQLLGDDVTEENMNERLGMLLMRKRRELAEQSRVKPMTKTHQRDYMREFVKNCSAAVYNQGWTMKKPTLDAPPAKRASQGAPQVPSFSIHDPAGVPAAPLIPTDASLPTASSSDPSAIPIPAVSIAHAAVSVPAEPMVDPAESPMDPPLTAPAHGSSEPTVAVPSPSSSRHHRKYLANKRVTPIVDVADVAMIKFDSDSDSDDDPLPYAPYAGWEMVPSPLGSVHAYHNMAGHTKHFTTLREILHMVKRTDLQRLLSAVDALYQSEDLDTFAFLLWEDLHVLFQSLDDADSLHFWHTQDSWRIHSGTSTLERMLKHGLEVSKLLLTMVHNQERVDSPCGYGSGVNIKSVDGCQVTKIWMVFTFHVSFWNAKWLVQEGRALVQEQTALGKDQSNPLIVGSLLKTTWSLIHHLLTDEVLTSPEQTATGKDVSNPLMAVMVCQKPLGYFSSPMIHVPRAELVFNPPG